ncbi:MAG: SAM-dependent chlorinase/fluorinase [Gammaproteobacteria bacterium]|nr:SAM-dependent chlorinase/fluorinase [Gammaproteobacteria bacterium]
MIVLFTDYGLQGPYIGQVKAVLHLHAQDKKVIDLIADAPRQNPKASAYLLSALIQDFPEGTIFFCVVDPAVGIFKDEPVVMKIDKRWYVGPDNGLFDIVARRAIHMECWKINWRPKKLSASFHGRDLYAPVCAMIANGLDIPGEKIKWQNRYNWPDDLNEIIYIDNFGNCMTGFRAEKVSKMAVLKAGKTKFSQANTFAEVSKGQPFWYENSNGLIEIAVNQGSAEKILCLAVGKEIKIDI